MRTRHLVSLIFFALFSAVFLSRHHIRDLSDVARTYSTFYPYLQHNQDVLVRFPTQLQSSDASAITRPESVPKIIHQIFLSNGRPNSSLNKYEPAIESCQALHPEWTFNMWTDSNATAFIAEFYPEILPHYTGYKQNIQRANILRYALLHHFGGVYLDLDVTCLASLDKPLAEGSDRTLTHLPWITPGAYPAGVNNAFILSRPQHPFLAELLGRVPSRDLPWPMPYVENMLSTGCMYFSNVWMSYALRLEREWQNPGVRKEDRVYILADEDGNMDPHMLKGKITTPLFAHGGASSWHDWDAAMIVMIGKHYGYFAFALGSLVGMIVLAGWKLARRNRPRRKSSWRGAISRLSLDRRSIEKHHLLQDEEQGMEKNG